MLINFVNNLKNLFNKKFFLLLNFHVSQSLTSIFFWLIDLKLPTIPFKVIFFSELVCLQKLILSSQVTPKNQVT
jgi:hypothetical protein